MAKHGGGILSEPNAQVDPTIRGDGPSKETAQDIGGDGCGLRSAFGGPACEPRYQSAIMFVQGDHVLIVRAPTNVNLQQIMENAKAQLSKPGTGANSFAVFPEGVELKVV